MCNYFMAIFNVVTFFSFFLFLLSKCEGYNVFSKRQYRQTIRQIGRHTDLCTYVRTNKQTNRKILCNKKRKVNFVSITNKHADIFPLRS